MKKLLALLLMLTLSLVACSKTEDANTAEKEEKAEETKVEEKETESAEVDYAAVYQEAITELDKAKEGKDVDFDMVIELYNKNLKELVQSRDTENEETNDQYITTALEAGKDGSLNKVVARQMFDKLMQKVFYTTMKHEFVEVTENWDDKALVKEEIEEAKLFYGILKSTVEKRDAGYGTTMVDTIAGGFSEIDAAVESDDLLAFNLGKQVVDKTLMKTFYFATGAFPNGYATKAAAAAKDNSEEAVIEQAEGWAFYQALYPYIAKHSPAEADYIHGQFDLQNDVTKLDPEAINKAFIRGFAKIALDEYSESVATWGEDKSVITALEGALFIDIIGSDIKTLIGEEKYTSLTEKAQAYLDAAKAKDKEKADSLMKELEAELNAIIKSAK